MRVEGVLSWLFTDRIMILTAIKMIAPTIMIIFFENMKLCDNYLF